jgi:3-oxoadipate enol-lactonase
MPITARGLNYSVTDLRPAWACSRTSGRPVLFHHGIGANHQIFDEWLPTVGAEHPIARYDMRGFGQSLVPPPTHRWTMPELIADLLGVAEAAFGTQPVHVLGESIGGTIALAAGLAHPSRFASVAMSNAAVKGGQIHHASGWRDEIARVGIKGWSERFMDMRFAAGAVPREALAWFAAVQERSPAHVVLGLSDLLINQDLTPRLADFKLPLLLMMPDRSPFVSLAQASAVAELVPQAEITVFPGARHGLPFSHAREAAATLIAFLRRVEIGPPPLTS